MQAVQDAEIASRGSARWKRVIGKAKQAVQDDLRKSRERSMLIRKGIREMWSRVKDRVNEAEGSWLSQQRTVATPLLQVELPVEDEPTEAPTATYISQAGWVYKERKHLAAKLSQIHREYSKITARDILKVLPEDDVVELWKRFQESGGSLDAVRFVEFMLEFVRRVRHIPRKEEEVLVEDLSSLFHSIDVDGSGRVSWEEFTFYIINAKSESTNASVDFMPYRRTKVQVKGKEPHRGTVCRFLPSMKKLLMVDTGKKTSARSETTERSIVSIVDPGNLSDVYGIVEHSNIVSATCYDPDKSKLMLCTETAILEIYSVRSDGRKGYSPDDEVIQSLNARLRQEHMEKVQMDRMALARQRVRQLSRAHCFTPQLCLHWEPTLGENGMLFGGSREGQVSAFDVESQEDSQLAQVLHTVTLRCKEPITSFIGISSGTSQTRIVASSFFGQVSMVDIEKGATWELHGDNPHQGHKQGVFSLDFCPDYNLLVSAGLEPEAVLWMPVHTANQYVGRLVDLKTPHKHPLIGAKFIPGTPQVITCDTGGMLKMWDVRKSLCMRTWTVHKGLSPLQAMAFEVTNFMIDPDPDSRAIYCTARTDTNETRLYTMHPERPRAVNHGITHDSPVVTVIFNQANHTILSASATDVRTWNCRNGELASTMPDIVDSQITSLCIDDRGRRIILGSHGGSVTVHSAATAALVKKYQGHTSEVSVVQYLGGVKLICSASLDGMVHLYGDSENPSSAPLYTFRGYGSVYTVAFSSPLHLVAFGDANEVVHIYDLYNLPYCHLQQRLVRKGLGEAHLHSVLSSSHGTPPSPPSPLELLDSQPQSVDELNLLTSQRIDEYINPKSSEITALIFLTPLPALVCSDATGHLSLWTTRPHPWSYMQLASWITSSRKGSGHVIPVVTSLAWCHDSDVAVVSGDDHGYISVWDITEICNHAALRPTSYPPPWEKHQPNPPEASQKRMPLLKSHWAVAENVPVTKVEVIPSASVIAVAAKDCLVTLWTYDGSPMGKLRQGQVKGVPVADDYLLLLATENDAAGYQDSPEVPGSDTAPEADGASEDSEDARPVEVESFLRRRQSVVCAPGSKHELTKHTAAHVASVVQDAQRKADDLLDDFNATPPGSPPHPPTPPPTPSTKLVLQPAHRVLTPSEPPLSPSPLSPSDSPLVPLRGTPRPAITSTRRARPRHLKQSMEQKGDPASAAYEAQGLLWDLWTQKVEEYARYKKAVAPSAPDAVGGASLSSEGIVFHRQALRPYSEPSKTIALLAASFPATDGDSPAPRSPAVTRAMEGLVPQTFTVHILPHHLPLHALPAPSPDSPPPTKSPAHHTVPRILPTEPLDTSQGGESEAKTRPPEPAEPRRATLLPSPSFQWAPPDDDFDFALQKKSRRSPGPVVPFPQLLHLSNPNYPIEESPYLSVGRSAPALSPLLFVADERELMLKPVKAKASSYSPRSFRIALRGVPHRTAFAATLCIACAAGAWERFHTVVIETPTRVTYLLSSNGKLLWLLRQGPKSQERIGVVAGIRYSPESRTMFVSFQHSAVSVASPAWPVQLLSADEFSGPKYSSLLEEVVAMAGEVGAAHDDLIAELVTVQREREEMYDTDRRRLPRVASMHEGGQPDPTSPPTRGTPASPHPVAKARPLAREPTGKTGKRAATLPPEALLTSLEHTLHAPRNARKGVRKVGSAKRAFEAVAGKHSDDREAVEASSLIFSQSYSAPSTALTALASSSHSLTLTDALRKSKAARSTCAAASTVRQRARMANFPNSTAAEREDLDPSLLSLEPVETPQQKGTSRRVQSAPIRQHVRSVKDDAPVTSKTTSSTVTTTVYPNTLRMGVVQLETTVTTTRHRRTVLATGLKEHDVHPGVIAELKDLPEGPAAPT